MRYIVVGLVVLASMITSCATGPTCQSTCNRLYAEDQCYIRRGGTSQRQLITRCRDECQDALKEPGNIGNYDPYERTGGTVSIDLDNESQAAIWMDCIAEQSCDRLEEGFCAPVW